MPAESPNNFAAIIPSAEAAKSATANVKISPSEDSPNATTTTIFEMLDSAFGVAIESSGSLAPEFDSSPEAIHISTTSAPFDETTIKIIAVVCAVIGSVVLVCGFIWAVTWAVYTWRKTLAKEREKELADYLDKAGSRWHFQQPEQQQQQPPGKRSLRTIFLEMGDVLSERQKRLIKETDCKSLLGNLAYTQRKVYGFLPKVVGVLMPGSVIFGHVEYRLEIKAIPHNSIEKLRTFSLTTRFKEVSTLHKTLGLFHKNLYPKDKFPSFAKDQYFGASTPETIAERKKHIELFLQFVLNNETLCKSKAFQTFLEASKEEVKVEDAAADPMQPQQTPLEVQVKPAEGEAQNGGKNETETNDLPGLGALAEEKRPEEGGGE